MDGGVRPGEPATAPPRRAPVASAPRGVRRSTRRIDAPRPHRRVAWRAGRDRSRRPRSRPWLRWHAFGSAASPALAFGFAVRAREPDVAAFQASMSWPAHGSKSLSSGSWVGRSASGTWIRLTRTRYQTAERPRIPSTRMSGGSRYADDLGVARLPALETLERLVLELRPRDLDDRDRRLAAAGRRRARAGPLGREAGVRVAGGHRGGALRGDLRRRAATFAAARLVLGLGRGAPSTAGRAAARRPASRSSAATARRPARPPRPARSSSSSPSSEPTASSMPAPGSPIAAYRAGTVAIVNASASTVGTSSQVSGVETRASGSGRTE